METYLVYWIEPASEEDMDRGRYEEGEKSFNNYQDAINFYNQIKDKKIYNVSLSMYIDKTLEKYDAEVNQIEKQAINFQEAFNAWYKDGKTIRCNICTDVWSKSENHCYETFPAYAINHGEWFICN